MCLRLMQHVAFKSECERETKTNGVAIERERIRETVCDKRHIANAAVIAQRIRPSGNAEVPEALAHISADLQN